MSEHKIGDQWIEVIDGKRYMLKAVESVDIGACTACDFEGQERKCAGFPNSVCGSNSNSFIIKDLGALNDDGVLGCPFYGEFPSIQTFHVSYCWVTEITSGSITLTRTGKSKEKSLQQAIDDWNRRA